MDLFAGGVDDLGEAAQAIAAHFKSIWLPVQASQSALTPVLFPGEQRVFQDRVYAPVSSDTKGADDGHGTA